MFRKQKIKQRVVSWIPSGGQPPPVQERGPFSFPDHQLSITKRSCQREKNISRANTGASLQSATYQKLRRAQFTWTEVFERKPLYTSHDCWRKSRFHVISSCASLDLLGMVRASLRGVYSDSDRCCLGIVLSSGLYPKSMWTMRQ